MSMAFVFLARHTAAMVNELESSYKTFLADCKAARPVFTDAETHRVFTVNFLPLRI